MSYRKAPADPHSLGDWAHHVGASERTQARLFVKETGLGFGLWRQRLRLVLSLDPLQAGAGVTEVAMVHGYEFPFGLHRGISRAVRGHAGSADCRSHRPGP